MPSGKQNKVLAIKGREIIEILILILLEPKVINLCQQYLDIPKNNNGKVPKLEGLDYSI